MLGLARETPDETDGVSLVQTLRNPETSIRDTLYWHYPHYSNQGGVPGGAIRAGNEELAAAMTTYLAVRLADLKQVKIREEGDDFAIELVFDEEYVRQYPVQFGKPN